MDRVRKSGIGGVTPPPHFSLKAPRSRAGQDGVEAHLWPLSPSCRGWTQLGAPPGLHKPMLRSCTMPPSRLGLQSQDRAQSHPPAPQTWVPSSREGRGTPQKPPPSPGRLLPSPESIELQAMSLLPSRVGQKLGTCGWVHTSLGVLLQFSLESPASELLRSLNSAGL